MKVRTFLGKTSMEGIRQLDEHINTWLAGHSIEVLHVSQCLGFESHHGREQEPAIIVSVWYEESQGHDA